ncbi:MAG: hypothetical protein AAF217_15820, partial [Pseudomonadota bacterium]
MKIRPAQQDGRLVSVDDAIRIVPDSADYGLSLTLIEISAGESQSERIYRLVRSDAPNRILNIQNGEPAFKDIPHDWWSGQWLVRRAEGGERIVSRWKPALGLGINKNHGVQVMSAESNDALWKIGIFNPNAKPKQSLASVADAGDIDISNLEARMLSVTPAVQKAAQKRNDVDKGDQQISIDNPARIKTITLAATSQVNTQIAANGGQFNNQVDQTWALIEPKAQGVSILSEVHPSPIISTKEDAPADPSPQEDAASQASVKPVASKNIKPNAAETGVEETLSGEKPAKPSFLERIKGAFEANNNATEEVGPVQSYLKLFVENVQKPGDVYWILADGFSFGEELYALRGGLQYPLLDEKKVFLRYGFNWARIEPFPVDSDFQSLVITEFDHKLELYKVSSGEGYYNETGGFLTYLTSDQAKLELDDTLPRDLSFTAADVGIYTFGLFWSENEIYKTNGDYRLTIEKGIEAFGVSDQFEVREEADAYPLVIKANASLRREWKESRYHVGVKVGFQYADRVTEWHKHFALGGGSFASGFQAAEAAGEIGAGATFELGKTYERQVSVSEKTERVWLTPYATVGA